MNLKQTINNAMKKDNWGVFAGGIAAPSDKYGYDFKTKFGEYLIQPLGKKYNSNKFDGYVLYFINTKNVLDGGLWQNLQKYNRLSQAMAMAKQHALYALKRLPSKYWW